MPPKPGGFPATPQTVAAAMTKPAARPVSTRHVEAVVNEEEGEQEEVLDDEIGDSLNTELDNDLKRLLAGE